jgi:peptide/nickel transport system permease protein
MFFFVVRRLLAGIPLICLVFLGLFFLVHAMPGDPSDFYINPDMPPTQIELIRNQMGLDDPILVQLGKQTWNYVTGDFGFSFAKNVKVSELIWQALPNTLLLSALSLFIIFTLGTLMGVISAVRQYTFLDKSITLGSLFLYSMPSFWLALMMVYVVAHYVPGWPISGMHGEAVRMKEAALAESLMLGLPPPPELAVGYWEKIWDSLKHLVLPAIALGIAPAAGVARYARSSMLEVIRMDYIRTAQAKGLPATKVIFKHALRNSLIPIVTLLGLYLPFLISGAVLVETIFAWPGMGLLIVEGIFTRDYPVIIANGLLLSLLVILGNLLADVLYGVVDPRISYD